MKKLLGVAALAGAAVLALSTSASASPVTDAASHLSPSHPVYVVDGAQVRIDSDATKGAKFDLAVAALPAAAGDAFDAARTIGKQVFASKRGVVVVISGTNVGADTNISGASGDITSAGNQALNDHPLKSNGDATALIKEFVAKANASEAGSSSSGSSGSSGSGHTGLIVFLVIVVAAAGGVGAWVFRRRARERKRLEGRRADVLSFYNRLGADVSNLDAKDDAVARQAIADASERYTATGSLLDHADSDGEYDAARRTALEGLQAARTARGRLGLDPGPELPPITPTQGEALTEEKEITVGDRTVRGYPDYTPGAPHYYGGGGGYGAGWYSFPFWETLFVGSMLSGGFGGFGGGGYGTGYDQGYDQGFDQGQDSGGDWGGGGGDWGGGGGDWGGGGGDWGGGGGDGGGGGW